MLKQISRVTDIIQKQMTIAAEEHPDAEYCPICYTNEIVPEGKELSTTETDTIELECKHRFCSECSLEMLKS